MCVEKEDGKTKADLLIKAMDGLAQEIRRFGEALVDGQNSPKKRVYNNTHFIGESRAR